MLTPSHARVRDVNELPVLEAAVRAAGRAVQRLRREGFETRMKKADNPVTAADLEANRILKEELLGAYPGDGWLSEETRDDRARLASRRVWIVDPIDGTKEFVTGLPEYSVSVALVDDGRALAGAVLNPAQETLVICARGDGVRRNGKLVRAERKLGERPVVLASRSEISRGEFKAFEARAEIRAVGSIAWKLALIACGDADATFSLGPKNEWDIAAGALLVEEAGGRATDRNREPFLFNRENTLVHGIVAVTPQAETRVWSLITSA